MSSPCFFLSYARRDETPDGLVRKFFEDLSTAVKRMTQEEESCGSEPGFIDQSLNAGDFWSEKISKALHSSRCLVALCSPRYFRSSYCGREMQMFRTPHKAYRLPPGKSQLAVERPVLLVIWKATRLARRVKDIQYFMPDRLNVICRDYGLEYIIKDPSQADNYQALILDLAKRVTTDVKKTPARDREDALYVKPLKRIPPAFPMWADRWAQSIFLLVLMVVASAWILIPGSGENVPALPRPTIIYPDKKVTRRLGQNPADKVSVTVDGGNPESQDENHWYCVRGTGTSNTGVFDYPAMVVERDPLRRSSRYLAKRVSCGTTVGSSNRFFLNKLGQD